MSKPDDIPQDVWDSVNDLFENKPGSTRDIIARAILAERERCAAIVEAYPPDGFFGALWERTIRYDETDPFWKFEGDTGNWAALMSVILAPYAAAIRKGGE